MPGLVPGIHVFRGCRKNVDGRDKPGHDETDQTAFAAARPAGYIIFRRNVVDRAQLRALTDEFDARMMVGEVGDSTRAVEIMAEYTSGGDKLHMSYTFDLLGPDFSAAYLRKCISAFETIVTDGWICWAFSNHDAERVASRWAGPRRL